MRDCDRVVSSFTDSEAKVQDKVAFTSDECVGYGYGDKSAVVLRPKNSGYLAGGLIKHKQNDSDVGYRNVNGYVQHVGGCNDYCLESCAALSGGLEIHDTPRNAKEAHASPDVAHR